MKYSITLPPLLKSEETALTTLAKEGPTNIYQIAKKSGKGYSLMFKAIKNLKERNLVQFIEERKTNKRTTAKIYDLNFSGILSVLQIELSPKDSRKWNYDGIRKIIKKYKKWLPLVFEKWDFFEKMNVETHALLRLKVIIESLNVERTYFLDLLYLGSPFVPNADLKLMICWLFYFIGWFPTTADFEDEEVKLRYGATKLLEALKHDKEIVTYFLVELETIKKTLKRERKLADRLAKVLI